MIDLRQRVKTSCDVVVSDHTLIHFSAALSAAIRSQSKLSRPNVRSRVP